VRRSVDSWHVCLPTLIVAASEICESLLTSNVPERQLQVFGLVAQYSHREVKAKLAANNVSRSSFAQKTATVGLYSTPFVTSPLQYFLMKVV
jgi:hypothetical protein